MSLFTSAGGQCSDNTVILWLKMSLLTSTEGQCSDNTVILCKDLQIEKNNLGGKYLMISFHV
jgi:hypothetical protein